jgi:quercetin dioxygenase-like cupin family protein
LLKKPGPIEVVQLTVDFSPGSWTSVHSHGGQAINLVLAGDITLREDGAERPHKAGQGWTDSTGRFHSAGNTGSGEARLLTTFLLPKGAPQTTVRIEPKLGPAIAHEARFDMTYLREPRSRSKRSICVPAGASTNSARASQGLRCWTARSWSRSERAEAVQNR